uniref:SRP receptor subunit alpha n=1 Tax=Petromyzon marinus TaxID=7757 RepID=S4RZ70_PETMA
MLDFFTIFSKGGIVLWCFQGVNGCFTEPVNALIRSVILQEKGSNNSFSHEALMLKYKLDNEFELVFVVGYQKILTLTYVDKFVDDIHKEFRDKYRNELQQKGVLGLINGSFEFSADFQRMLWPSRQYNDHSESGSESYCYTFWEATETSKTVKSMIQITGEKENKKGKAAKNENGKELQMLKSPVPESMPKISGDGDRSSNGIIFEEKILKKPEELFRKQAKIKNITKKTKAPKPTKTDRVWDFNDKPVKGLSYGPTENTGTEDISTPESVSSANFRVLSKKHEYEHIEEEEEKVEKVVGQSISIWSSSGRGIGGVFGMLKGLVGSKSLTREDLEPVLEKMKDHLIAKNVAAEISLQLCESVANKLEGKVQGTFKTVTSTVKQALQDSLLKILQPKRHVDILRDVIEAKKKKQPYVITFCGVNGVGKSTNLAKTCFWLIENEFSVLVAACDTFRAGAVEQLRTHTRHLSALHPPENHGGRPMVQLFERGYGKDAAGIAMEAKQFATSQGVDVVLVDTAGRMQNNTPLMVALAKLIAVNIPDLVLFVGEALVGNEAVDQLVKFNRALADNSHMEKPRLIDGIVLTKFDTIDDKVGAAVSMTYITGQPIVFVGTGQTYCDLRRLDVESVVHALMKP